jgi:acetyltransferase-like isoleucine patch superfamily enzyme
MRKKIQATIKRLYTMLGFRLQVSEPKILSLNQELSKYSIGRYSYGVPAPRIIEDEFNPQATVKIGSFCSIAENVTILLGKGHRTDWVTTYPFNLVLKDFKEMKGNPITRGDVIIGNDVWIGRNAFIRDGVTIGDGAVIGAYSVVTKNVEPYAIVAGNPARVIRKRFDQETIDNLLKIRWWDWDIERIKENMPFLLQTT